MQLQLQRHIHEQAVAHPHRAMEKEKCFSSVQQAANPGTASPCLLNYSRALRLAATAPCLADPPVGMCEWNGASRETSLVATISSGRHVPLVAPDHGCHRVPPLASTGCSGASASTRASSMAA